MDATLTQCRITNLTIIKRSSQDGLITKQFLKVLLGKIIKAEKEKKLLMRIKECWEYYEI